MIEERSGPIVSVQRRSAESLLAGQLGTGVLVAPNTVITTRDTTRRVGDYGGSLEVVLGPSQFLHDADGVVERHNVSGASLTSLTWSPNIPGGPSTERVAVLTLEGSSVYLPVAGWDPDADRAAQAVVVIESLMAGADVMTALQDAQVIPQGFRDEPQADWLAAASLHLRRKGTRFRFDEIEVPLTNPICHLVKWLC